MSTQLDKRNIAANPCAKTKIGRTERGEMTILSRDELAAVLEAIGEHWRPLVITLAGTGLRFGEATALQVRDFDLEHVPPLLRVSRSWKHTDTKDRELGPPKSEKGRRLVSLPPEVVAVVRPLVNGRAREAFVFVNTVGAPVRQNSFHEVWTAAVKRSGIGKRPRVHDLRHSHVASQIAQGVPLPVIQRRLGHEQITTTIDTYGHLADDALSVAAQAASMYLSPAAPELLPDARRELDAH
jgi:integrase